MSLHTATSRRATYATALVAVVVGLLALASGASANTFTATDTASFVNAVNSANATSGANTIVVAGGIYGPTSTVTFTNTSGPLTIVNQSSKQPPAKFDGGAVQPFPSSLFAINKGVTVNFVNIEVTTGGGSNVSAIDSNGTANFDRSLIAGNNSNGLQIEPNATSTITNSTFSDGLAFGIVDQGSATITNSTIALNNNGGIDNSSGVLNLTNTIVAKNGPTTAPIDCLAPATTSNHSLDSDNSCGVGALAGKNPLLGGLVQQGGSHPVHTLLAGSPASDAADPAKCPAVDERNAPRPDDAGTPCDIGAVEAGVTLSPTTTTLATSGSPTVQGQSVTFTANVSSLWFPTETGTVQFMDGATTLGAPVALSGGTATLTTSSLGGGTHTITAVYGGDAKNKTSTSPAVTQVVDFPLTATGAAPLTNGVEGFLLLSNPVPASGVVATFTDADPNGTASQFTATIDWGDGSTSPGSVAASGSGFAVSGSHTYAEDGTYTVKVSIADVAGATASATTSSTVAEPSNAVAALLDQTVEPLPVVGPLF